MTLITKATLQSVKISLIAFIFSSGPAMHWSYHGASHQGQQIVELVLLLRSISAK
jgi:hypothetical protein